MNIWKMMNHESKEEATAIMKKKSSKKKKKKKKKRFLVSVSVLGSAGPLRFVANEDDEVSNVIDTALKAYAREGRFPVLDSNSHNFLLYCTNTGSDALSPSEKIGSMNGRDFLLCKKELRRREEEGEREEMKARRSHGWRAWLHKSFSFKIL